ncbi:argininosuccinate lyase [bacterium]|nr:argininosuccinate lyase [bacterium]
MNKSNPLWNKGYQVDDLMLRLTVGTDYLVDCQIARFDCIGSAAHAKMLESIGILKKDELVKLLAGLKEIAQTAAEGNFQIPVELEDAHTVIESKLAEKYGETGKRIHAGRSRNDQILLATRLYTRHLVMSWTKHLLDLSTLFFSRAQHFGHIAMPGYTHLQRAMPSSVAMWMHAFAEGTLDLAREGLGLILILNRNPLGAGAGFGSSLPLDREMVARLLGFDAAQRSVIDVQNSRGRNELRALQFAARIASLYEKLGWDFVLYCSEEFGFIKLPKELTTGSSIMPQKRNPDLAELLRGKASRVRSKATELEWVIAKLPSNYHRDLQYSKEPLVAGAQELADIFAMTELLVKGFTLNQERLQAAMTSELYATYEAFRLVQSGMPFRDAYQQVAQKVEAKKIDKDALESDFDFIKQTADQEIIQGIEELNSLVVNLIKWHEKISLVEQEVFHSA